MQTPSTLLLVPGHSLLKDRTSSGQTASFYGKDEAWLLESFQKGESVKFLEHIQAGLTALAEHPNSLLVFSGGRTRAGAEKWSEAASYLAVAQTLPEWRPDFSRRVLTEEFARDSFQNLLYSLCRFREATGEWPQKIKVLNWGFKNQRFDFHRSALGLSSDRFRFIQVNNPHDLYEAQKGELRTLAAFMKDPYGIEPEGLGGKRAQRNPHRDLHPYHKIAEARKALDYIENPQNLHKPFSMAFPWNNELAEAKTPLPFRFLHYSRA